MLIGIDVNETFDYIHPDDNKENPTVFVIGVLLKEHQGRIFKGAINQDGTINYENIIGKVDDILMASLKEIRNYQTNDKSMPRNYIQSEINKDLIASIPFVVSLDLAKVIIDFNFPSKAEEKK